MFSNFRLKCWPWRPHVLLHIWYWLTHHLQWRRCADFVDLDGIRPQPGVSQATFDYCLFCCLQLLNNLQYCHINSFCMVLKYLKKKSFTTKIKFCFKIKFWLWSVQHQILCIIYKSHIWTINISEGPLLLYKTYESVILADDLGLPVNIDPDFCYFIMK